MTSLRIEELPAPSTTRRLRALEAARMRVVDKFAERTVWCACALPGRRPSAQRLQASLQWGSGGVACSMLAVSADERLRDFAERLEAMLAGASPTRLGPAERELCADCVGASEELVVDVRADDVVVVHDALTALLAQALRERGAHAVWYVSAAPPARGSTAGAAWSFLRRYTSSMDAYVMSWSPTAERSGAGVERIAAVMPSPDAVTATDIQATFASGEPRLLGWSTVLAEVVQGDRDETVGGTLQPRPTVPVR
jgi:hypothetical protein